jgi:hypothetical protein
MRRYQAFTQDKPMPRSQKLWRYLSFEKFAWLLETSKLHHTRLDLLGDPFEGSVTRPYARKRDAAEGEIASAQARIERLGRQMHVFFSYATCWHASSFESAAMWKLYCSENAGIAVVSSVESMLESVDVRPFQSAILGPVDYLDFDNDEMYLSRGLQARPGFLKRKSFEHEREVRGMGDYVNYAAQAKPPIKVGNIPDMKDKMPRGVSVTVDLGVLVGAIYISPLAPAYFVELVEIMAERHGLKDCVRRSTLLGDPVF